MLCWTRSRSKLSVLVSRKDKTKVPSTCHASALASIYMIVSTWAAWYKEKSMAYNFKEFSLVGCFGGLFGFLFPGDNCPDNLDYPSLEYSSTSVLIMCKFIHHFTEFVRQEAHCSELLYCADFGWYVQQGTQLFFMYTYGTIRVNSAGDFKHCVFHESGVFIMTTVAFLFSLEDIQEKDYVHYVWARISWQYIAGDIC